MQLASRDAQLRRLLDGLHSRGMQVAAPPKGTSLEVGAASASDLPRVLLYGWEGWGWLEGRLVARNTNTAAMVNGDPINLIAWYESDNCEAQHALDLDSYGAPRISGWLLFEPMCPTSTAGTQEGFAALPERAVSASEAEAAALPEPSMASSSVAPRKRKAAVHDASGEHVDEANAPISVSRPRRAMEATHAKIQKCLGVPGSSGSDVGAAAAAPATSTIELPSAVLTVASGGGRARALFTRTSLEGQALPPTFLLGTSPGAAVAGVKARIKEQGELTGQGHEAMASKMRRVQSMDLYLQAASAGHAGLHGSEVGGQLFTLRSKVVYAALLFGDMVRKDGVGRQSVLAFPRGGMANRVFATLTRQDAHDLLGAMNLMHVVANVQRTRAEIRSLVASDERVVSGEGVLNVVFARLVRTMHAKGGIYECGMSNELLEAGLKKLQVGPLLVKQFAEALSCNAFGRQRVAAADDPMEVIGWLNEQTHARDALGNIQPYSEDYVKTSKSILGWWLRMQGWESARMPSKGDRPAYYAVVALEGNRTVRRAYFLAKSLSRKQKLYRAMAATEDVMQILMLRQNISVALDLQMVTAEELSYRLGLRVSDVEHLTRRAIGFGKSEQYADVEFKIDRSKADASGVSFTRWLQHCHSCKFKWRSNGNEDGRGWSLETAAMYQCTSHAPAGSRCPVCLLLMLLNMQGEAPEDAPLFRKMALHARWSFDGGSPG